MPWASSGIGGADRGERKARGGRRLRMFQIEAAGLVIRIENRYDDVRDLCRDYLTAPDRPADIAVSVSEEEWTQIQEEAQNVVKKYLDQGRFCQKLKQSKGIAVGFVEGDLVLL